ncbi:MAG: hypothetical protein GXP09_02760 [Gammaproteobacteria bacterium]|nr:hypothetical protein [Gammaproteobacteria bacterium]
MPKHRLNKTLNAELGLELMMRDSLSGMEEWVAMTPYQPWLGEMEIISIECPDLSALPCGPKLTH